MSREEIDEIKRHLGVMMESLETKIALVAEGIVNVDQKLDRTTAELREHQHAESEETRSLIRLS